MQAVPFPTRQNENKVADLRAAIKRKLISSTSAALVIPESDEAASSVTVDETPAVKRHCQGSSSSQSIPSASPDVEVSI